ILHPILRPLLRPFLRAHARRSSYSARAMSRQTSSSEQPSRPARVQATLDALAAALVILAATAVIAVAVSFWWQTRTSAAALIDPANQNVPKAPQSLGDAPTVGNANARIA